MSDKKPLLSITIPTYNRAGYLDNLLRSISAQIARYADIMEVIICDNASTDNTQAVVERFLAVNPCARYVRNDVNIGMDGNFKKCFDSASGVYVWMIGDDDRLSNNALDSIFELLHKEECIDLLYLSSTIHDNDSDTKLSYSTQNSGYDFIKHVGIMFTFISGIIFNKSHYQQYPHESKCEMEGGTFLLHMFWQLYLLKYGKKFAIIHNNIVHATPDNSGGYRLFTVFSRNLSFLLDKFFERNNRISKKLRLSSALFLLNFVNNTSKTKDFDVTDYVGDCDTAFNDLLFYRYFLRFFYLNPAAVKGITGLKQLAKKILRK